ncbi:unnamed protein product [Rhizophagus irregularis]|nr:unnamed protein product [Rhizophagus irregularis]
MDILNPSRYIHYPFRSDGLADDPNFQISDRISNADNINHFLSPIVTELLEFWTGVIIKTPNNPTGKTVRMAIICCSSNIPAARKLCGHIYQHWQLVIGATNELTMVILVISMI